MGLFNKRKTDDGRTAESTPEARNSDTATEALSERPTEPMRTEVAPAMVAEARPEEPPQIADGGAPDHGAETETGASAADLTPPEPEAEELVVVRSGPDADVDSPTGSSADTGGIEKEELRRAVSLSAKQEQVEEEERRSAEDLIAPVPQRHHPFQPEMVEERATTRMKVYVFANQKGGVAKTTTTLNLAVALSESGYDVLCIDLDPQGNLTMSQGVDPDEVEKSMYDVLVDRMPISEVIHRREIDIAVASIDLAGAEIAMSTQIGRERTLQKALLEIADDYDFVCIDTPPSLGLLTINALTAANKVIVPVQCEYLSMRGLVQLQNTLQMIRENLNPDVEIEGILPTMLDSRTVHAKEAVEILEENFGDLVFKSRIKKAIKFAEAPVKGSSVLKYDPTSNAAGYYRDLAEEVLTHGQAT